MRIISYLILIIGLTLKTFSAEPLAAIKKGKDWNIIDTDGKIISTLKNIESLEGYREGIFRAKVLESGTVRWVYYNLEGKKLFTVKADEAYDFYEGLAITANTFPEKEVETLFGFINTKGEKVIDNNLIDALPFNEGLAFVASDNLRGYINTKGELALSIPSNLVGNTFSEGKAAVQNPEFKIGYINTKGEVIIPFDSEEPGEFKEGLVKYTKNGKTGLIDSTNKVIIKPEYYEVKGFSQGRSFISLPDEELHHKWALIDDKGTIITPHLFKYVNEFSEDLASVKIGKLWIFIERNGNPLLNDKYRFAGSFKNGLAWVSKYSESGETEAGFINKKGEMVIDLSDFEECLDLRFNKKML